MEKKEAQIKPTEKKDLPILNKQLGARELPWLHEEKFKEQEKGNSLWLIAWKDKKPIAHIQIRFNDSKIKKVKDNLKNYVHLESLYVKDNFRKKGVATKIINFAEKLAKEKNFNKIGLSVEKGNKFLLGLYMKKGYRDWKKGIVIEKWKELNSDGKIKDIIQKSHYLIKKLK